MPCPQALSRVQIETYLVPYKRIISCGRLDTKFGLVTGIPERHAYFTTTKQAGRGLRGRSTKKKKKKKTWEEVT